jgi:hypothetical protein
MTSVAPLPPVDVAGLSAVQAKDMAGLKEVLGKNQIDASSLKVLFKRDGKEVCGLEVHGSQAVDLWRKLRGLAGETGCWPVILGGAEGLASHREMLESAKETPADIVGAAQKVDVAAWVKKRREENAKNGPEASYETGKWPASPAVNNSFTIPTDILKQTPLPAVCVALIPTTRPWEVPAWLQFGGWNECPMPDVQVAFMKYWYDKYGAEVVGISHDVVEMQVARQPADKDAALELARQQFAYCEDIVTQGVGDVEALAASLLKSPIWYFWWD